MDRLRGCINDVTRVVELLVATYGFSRDNGEIQVLVDRPEENTSCFGCFRGSPDEYTADTLYEKLRAPPGRWLLKSNLSVGKELWRLLVGCGPAMGVAASARSRFGARCGYQAPPAGVHLARSGHSLAQSCGDAALLWQVKMGDEDPEEILGMACNDCTTANVLKGIHWLTQGAQAGDTLFFHFSGYTTHVPDEQGDEVDGMDEALCTMDFCFDVNHGILDRDLRSQLFDKVPKGVHLLVMLDTCHSGTLLDKKISPRSSDSVGSFGRIPSHGHIYITHSIVKGRFLAPPVSIQQRILVLKASRKEALRKQVEGTLRTRVVLNKALHDRQGDIFVISACQDHQVGRARTRGDDWIIGQPQMLGDPYPVPQLRLIIEIAGSLWGSRMFCKILNRYGRHLPYKRLVKKMQMLLWSMGLPQLPTLISTHVTWEHPDSGMREPERQKEIMREPLIFELLSREEDPESYGPVALPTAPALLSRRRMKLSTH
ncbi:hypothetical protein CYMTET_35382 [Cymbomonas tetramitiformis]|uniref:Peptidase C14 caspase domain-containing protein n=1 Tax=Cymbomonas tetramitiformis TaxID=36881 RepID=A0AAE0F998_9CHLO|nr:hypothetical protein CYMTET_35382 [Cymbomonas tetramitiformis]